MEAESHAEEQAESHAEEQAESHAEEQANRAEEQANRAGNRAGEGTPRRRVAPDRRRSLIVDEVLAGEEVRIEEVAENLGVSVVTVYRDVQILEGAGLIERSKGVLRPRASSTAELPPGIRRTKSPREKAALSRAAASLVSPGDVLMIDDSSTALPMVAELESVYPLTVVTNSMVVGRALAESKTAELVLIGGRYLPWADAFYGSLATSFVEGVRADLCVMSDAAVWGDGVYNPVDVVVELKRAMLRQSSRRVLLVDSTKFERRAWQKTAPLRAFDTILVDGRTKGEHVDMLRAGGAEVVVVPVDGDTMGV